MTVNSIRLCSFRSYGEADVSFSPGVNVIAGDNAQGKTNLLEAVYMLSCGKAFRARTDRDAVNYDAPGAVISASVTADGREQSIEIRIPRTKRKELFVNGVKKRSVADFAGTVRAVLFSPGDLDLIREGAYERRRFLDMCISQLRPRYAEALAKFSKAYEEKTRILRDSEEKPSLLEFLDEYDRHLAVLSSELIHYRAKFIAALSPIAAEIHREFSGGREELTLRYKTVSTVTDPLLPAAEILPLVMEHQRTHAAAERAGRMCLTGAHKDDIEVFIDGKPAREFASQGQMRTAALSIKLAERELHYRDSGEYPVLLLDDVLSELDEKRQSFVLNRITGGQVLITCCEDEKIAKRTGAKVLYVRMGEII